MSTYPPPHGRGDENEWDVNEQSSGHWPSPPPQPPQSPQVGPGPPPAEPPSVGPYAGQHTAGPPNAGSPYAGPHTAGPPPRRKRTGLIVLAAVVIVVVGIGIGWGAAVLLPNGQSNDSAVSAPSDAAGTQPSDEAAEGNQEGTAPTPTETALPDDPGQALKQLAETDKTSVMAELDGKWVPQLSSKKKGLEAEGKTWNDKEILDEHQGLREKYPRVQLIWSGDFASFKEDNFWVSIAGIGYDNPEGALSWCSTNGLGADHCYAKQLNTSGGHEGTTRLQD